MSHPNRSKTNPGPARNPKPEEIRQLRLSVGLSPKEAAARLHAAVGAWMQWEAGERPMHPAFWRLFRIAASARTIGRVTCQLADADDPHTYVVKEVQTRSFLGIIAGPSDGRWACFYVSNVGAPRPSGLEGGYEHVSLDQALSAFEPAVDLMD